MTAAVAGAAVALGRMGGAARVAEATAGDPVTISGNVSTVGGTTVLNKTGGSPVPTVLILNSVQDGLAVVSSATIGVSVLGVTYGVFGATNTANATALYGTISAANGFGVIGTTSAASTGVWGNSSGGVGVLGISGGTHAVFGSASQASSSGVFGKNTNVSGVGVTGTNDSGIGVQATSQTSVGMFATSGSSTAVVGRSTTGKAAEFFGNVEITGDFTASGMKSAAVRVGDGSVRRMYCLESPVSFFEDMGTGQVTDGHGSVTLDPVFLSTVTSDEYQVYLTPEGDCRGLFVASKSSGGFTVGELMGGNSDVKFSWRVVAKRAGIVNERFAPVSMSLDSKAGPKPSSQREIQLPTLPAAPSVTTSPH